MEKGIDLNRPINYYGASLRYFSAAEKHIDRVFKKDVLLMVFEGTLRFTENGIKREVSAGEYYIQKKNLPQSGDEVSDSPKYLYVHFDGNWAENNSTLACRGNFDIGSFLPMMQDLDRLYHAGACYIAQTAKFYEILAALRADKIKRSLANDIAEYMAHKYLSGITLDSICDKFHFSKNHIINIFKKEYGVTPAVYINDLKLSRAEYLLEITSDEIESIAYSVGFSNYSNFYRSFYRKNNMSPKEWRLIKRL